MTQAKRVLPQKPDTTAPLLTTLSHDLKSLLTSIKAYGQILEKRLAKSNEQEAHKYSTKLNKQITLFTQDLVEYLDIVRIHSNALSLSKELIFFDDLVADVMSQIEKNYGFIIHKGKTQHYIYGNKKRLVQVLITLLENAIKHTAEDSKITLYTKATTKEIIAVVENEGKPLNQEQMNSLFHLSEDTQSAGTRVSGVSLFIADAIIQAHNGEIDS